jgi:glycosyltransferase involved in cell wall biosynthesis
LYHANLIGRFAAIGQKCNVISSVRNKLVNRKFSNFIDFLTQGLVDTFTVNSKALENFVVGYGISKKKIAIIENGIDINKFKPSKSIENIKKELKLKNIPTITSVASLTKQKDYPTLIRAISFVQKQLDVNFLIVGKGTGYEDETNKIKNLIQRLGLKNVRILGYRQDIPNILAVSDVWVSSTLYEGQSNSLLEAMAMKKAIVTTNIPENSEVVVNNKEALFIPIKSPVNLSDALIKLLNDKKLAKKLGENAYKKLKADYDIKQTIRKIEDLYKK